MLYVAATNQAQGVGAILYNALEEEYLKQVANVNFSNTSMTKVRVRSAKREDARGILEAHYSAVHLTAAKDYSSEIAKEWSPPVSIERIETYLKDSFTSETTLVAEIDKKIVGFGSIVESNNELRAVYVSAEFVGVGVGSCLLRELEALAKAKGCKELQMDSSLTAAPFYQRHGYQALGQGHHTLRSGNKMACVKMRKTFT